jgi:hypothetical protein
VASEGPNNPGTTANEVTTGQAWSNTSNAVSSNNSYASTTADIGGGSDGLRCTNFGFSIPGGATIDGIIVEVERKCDLGAVIDSGISLVIGGITVGDDKSSADSWPTSDGTKVYGGSSDLWGDTWTDSEINDSGFGVQVGAIDQFAAGDIASVDHVKITVHYTESGGGGNRRRRMMMTRKS